ncbi:hypothetical protein AGOR_G00045470 [Albula goreensis]|uniref:Uncharacterized protein n=1 Tax=Albula goreensis TaxID=1534307 RepID=A0A8T3E4F1_9TELE|nr:hypothetical protein AGOR_G00045470 [Albula goreensis]
MHLQLSCVKIVSSPRGDPPETAAISYRVCPRIFKMAERSPWWRTFTTRKRSSPGSKDQAVQQPSPDTDIQPDGDNSASTTASGRNLPAESQQDTGRSSVLRGETYEDAECEPVFNEQTSRRNLKISRSGRYKEKRKVRASIPEDYQGNTSGKDDTR